MSDIKSMGLYRNIDRVLADLAASGIGPEDALTVDHLTSFDQYHYEGTDAVDDAIEALGAAEGGNILDVGSGLGGPARYIADRSGALVTALELQPDLNETAAALTRRCDLDNLVSHVRGDVLAGDAGEGLFTGIVSMLCILHIPDRTKLFTKCAEALHPGGRIFIDDYVARGPLHDREREQLASTVYCTYLPTEEQYVDDVASAGFVEIVVEDKTDSWTDFVIDRLAAFHAAHDELVDRYDEVTVDGLDHFYSTVVELFRGGNLGGLRLTARLPDSD